MDGGALGARGQEICSLAGQTFGRKESLDNFWQDLAEQFYPERALHDIEDAGRGLCVEALLLRAAPRAPRFRELSGRRTEAQGPRLVQAPRPQ